MPSLYLCGVGFVNEEEASYLGKDTLNIGGGSNAHLSLSQIVGWYGLLLHCILIGRNDELWSLWTASSANSTMDLGLSTLKLTGRSGRWSISAMTASRGKIPFIADGGGRGDNKLASPPREGGGVWQRPTCMFRVMILELLPRKLCKYDISFSSWDISYSAAESCWADIVLQ